MAEPKKVDCRGLSCPQPVIEAKKALESAVDSILVIVDNEGSCDNVGRFARSQGAGVAVSQEGDEFHLTITPDPDAPPSAEPPIVCADGAAEDLVVFISSEGMGRGDDELGGILMAAFLDTLAQFKDQLTHVILVNAGAKLSVEGSPVLDQLRQLEEVGAELLVCGTCLNHFGIADRLAVGRVSNMLAIIETLSRAGRIIQP